MMEKAVYYLLAALFFRILLKVLDYLATFALRLGDLVLRLNKWAQTRIEEMEKQTRIF